MNALIENILKSIPIDIDNEKREEIKENLSFISTEIQSTNPRKPIIKKILIALKTISSTAGFLASIAKLYEFFGF